MVRLVCCVALGIRPKRLPVPDVPHCLNAREHVRIEGACVFEREGEHVLTVVYCAQGRYLIFVDADTLISPALLRATLATLDRGRICGGGTVVTVDPHQPSWVQRVIRWTSAAPKLCKWACGAYVYCLREAFIDTGGFDERYYATEEIYFSRALKRWGRSRGMRFEILNEPIETSMRKIEWYSPFELLRMMLAAVLIPTRIRSQADCGFWYTRPNAKPRGEAQ